MTSGVTLFDDIIWLSFYSGYDFGHITDSSLLEEHEFFYIWNLFPPIHLLYEILDEELQTS